MKEKKLLYVFIGIALLCSTCSKEDPEIQIVEGIELEALSDEEVFFLDNLEKVELSADEVVLSNGQTLDEYLLMYDPDFYNEINTKSTLATNLSEPKMTKDLLVARLNMAAIHFTTRSNFIYPGDDMWYPSQNGLAYSWGQKIHTKREAPPGRKCDCTEEVYGLDCSGLIYQMFLQSGVKRGIWTRAEFQRRPDTLKKYIQIAFPNLSYLKVEDLGKIAKSEVESGDIIYWLKTNGQARHIGMILKNSSGELSVAQSNGTRNSSSICQDNYGPDRGPSFLKINSTIEALGLGNNYGIVRFSEETLVFNTCNLEMEILGQYEYVTKDTSYTQDGDIIFGAESTGSFSGNTYTGSYSGSLGTYVKITGNIEAIIDESRTKIDSFNWSEQLVHPNYTVNKVLKAKDIPFSSSSSGFVFSISGETVKDHIITLKEEQISNDGLSYSIKKYQSQFDSYFLVEFYTE